MNKRFLACALALISIALISGCGDDPPQGNNKFNAVLLRPDRFPSLYEGLVYQGWLANLDEDSNWVDQKSIGTFFWDEHNYRFLKSDGSQEVRDSVFLIGDDDVYNWEMIAITLEGYPTDADPSKPSPTIVAQGAIIREVKTFMSFPVAFDAIPTGTFVLATFSDGNWSANGESDKASERFGLWFLNLDIPVSTNPVDEIYKLGISLPVLPDTGYLYEGWVALEGGDTISTGKFYYTDYYDYSNSHCELRGIPNFPGEDFLLNKPDWIPAERWPLEVTRGGVAFITVEPNPDNDLRRPSNLVVLRGNLPKPTAGNYAPVRSTNFPIGSVAGITFPRIEAAYLQIGTN